MTPNRGMTPPDSTDRAKPAGHSYFTYLLTKGHGPLAASDLLSHAVL